MKPICMDSFDHYSDPALKYYDTQNATIVRNAGRFGTDACQLEQDGYLTFYRPLMDMTFVESYPNYRLVIVGLAYNRTIAVDGPLVDFCLYPNIATSQVTVGVKADGKIYVSSGSDYGETSRRITTGQWYYIELKTEWDSFPAGSVEIHVNGNVWGTVSNLGGANLSDPPAYNINAVIISGSGTPYLDDIYLLAGDPNDAPNPPNDDFWGDTRIETSFPTSDGAYQDWTPSSGSFGYLMVNNPYAQFTDNVYTYPQYQRETFGMTYNIALPGTVNAVQHSYLSRQVNWSESIVYTSGSLYYPFSVPDDWRISFPANFATAYLSTIWEKDPSSGSVWDSVNLPVAEFGFMSNTSSGSL